MTWSELRTEALKLSEARRLELASELLGSVDNAPSVRSDEDPAWIAELERRAQAVLDGAPTIPWDEVRKAAEDSFPKE